jgi:hypothetical protein
MLDTFRKQLEKTLAWLPTHIWFLLLLVVAGYFGNYFSFSLFFGIDFLFGSIFSWLVLSFYGFWWGLVSAAIASFYTYNLWHHPYAMIIFLVEFIFVAYFWNRKSRSIPFYDAIYWFCIGIPLVFLFYKLNLSFNWQGTITVALKQAVNGIFNAELASLLLTYVPFNKIFAKNFAQYKYPLNQIVFDILIAFIIFPILLTTILNANERFVYIEREIDSTLSVTSQVLAEDLQSWEDQHLDLFQTIIEVAILEGIESLNTQLSLENMLERHPDLAYVAFHNTNGKVLKHFVSTSSLNLIKGNSNLEISVRKLSSNRSVTTEILHREGSSYLRYIFSLEDQQKYFIVDISLADLDIFLQEELKGLQPSGLRMLLVNREQEVILDSQKVFTDQDHSYVGELWNLLEGRDSYTLGTNTIVSQPPLSLGLPAMKRWRQSFGVTKVNLEQMLLPADFWIALEIAPYIDILEAYYIRNLSIVLFLLRQFKSEVPFELHPSIDFLKCQVDF